MVCEVDLKRSFNEGCFRSADCPCGTTPHDGLHACQQFKVAERLRDVVICAGFEAVNLVQLAVAGRQHDDRGIGRLPQRGAYVQPADVREAHVKDDNVWLLQLEQ